MLEGRRATYAGAVSRHRERIERIQERLRELDATATDWTGRV